MNWIKDKIKRFYKLVIGLLIPVALAAPLALPPEDTIYRFAWKEAYNYISCHNDYQCNKNVYLKDLAERPELFTNTQEIAGENGTFTYLKWIEFNASTTRQALEMVRKDPTNAVMDLEAKTIYETWYTKYDYGKVKKELDNPTASLPSKILAFFFPVVFAAGPTHSFETCSTGDLTDCGGGSGWVTADWGVSGCDIGVFDVVSTPVKDGSRGIGITSNGGFACDRDFTAITDDTIVTVFARAAQSTNDLVVQTTTTTSAIERCLVGGFTSIRCANNLTLDSIVSFSIDTWYKIDVKVTSFVGKTWQVQIDDGGFSADKTFYNNNAATQIDRYFIEESGTSKLFYVDELGGIAAVADVNLYESGSFFNLTE